MKKIILNCRKLFQKLSNFEDETDLFQNLTLDQRADFDPSSIINQRENILNNNEVENTSKNDPKENPINQLKNEKNESFKENIQNNS